MGKFLTSFLFWPRVIQPMVKGDAGKAGKWQSWGFFGLFMGTGTILLVDDEPYVIAVLARKLQQLGHTVLSAENGEKGLAAALQNLPDLIVTDFQMPVMDGLEMATLLRKSAATSGIPLLMLTARGHRLESATLAGTNIKAILPKPFSIREVTAKVNEFIGMKPRGARSAGQVNSPASQKHGGARVTLDTAANVKAETTISQFGDHLAQAYEEVNVLLGAAGLLKDISEPARAMQSICQRIAETFGFGWVTLRFADTPLASAALKGRTFLAGQIPYEAGEFKQLLEGVQHEIEGGAHSPVLDVAQFQLARGAGTEAIAQPVKRDARVIGLLVAGGKAGADTDVTSGEIRFLEATAHLTGVFVENVARFDEQRAMFLGTLRAMTASIDAKDPYTLGHSERVAHLAALTALALGLDAHTVERFHVAGLLHDVGKIGVPEAVLVKSGKLNELEFAMIKRHPEIGYGILKDIPGLEDVLPGVLHHHEKWDGTGYPHGLAGEQIPLIARVLALADTFDAMSSDRSYRQRMSRERVLDEIRRFAGIQFDHDLALRFVHLSFDEFDAMVARFGTAAVTAAA
jgi:response regulator RpfG family c-di-GMP phosphodiesterase